MRQTRRSPEHKTVSAGVIRDVMKKSPFNRLGELFEQIFIDINIERLRRTLQVVPPAATADSRLLDIGCYGPMISLYKELFGYRQVAAVANYEWEALAKAYENVLPAESLRLQVFVDLDVEAKPLPLTEASIDTVLLLEVLEHFCRDPMAVMAEINRVLKPGGVLVLSTPNALGANLFYRMVTANNPFEEPYNGIDSNRHNRFYSPAEIARMAEDAGFAVEELTTLRLLKPWPYRLARALLAGSDALLRLKKKFPRKGRGEFILARLKKTGPVLRRYPEWLYLPFGKWHDWLEKYGRTGAR